MGLFKSKEERRIEREMKIRSGMRSIEKSIRQQERFAEDFIKNARHARQIGDEGQYQFVRGALKKTAAVKKMLERQLLAIKNAMANGVSLRQALRALIGPGTASSDGLPSRSETDVAAPPPASASVPPASSRLSAQEAEALTADLRALFDAKALTLARTAAVSALASSILAKPEARTLLMVGTGALAPHLVRAHAAVRTYETVLVWGRSVDRAAAIAAELHAEGLPARPSADLEAGVREADVVSCATLSQSPLVRGAWLKPGAHLDLVGGYTLTMREADDEAIGRARVFVDTRNALIEAGDLADPVRNGLLEPAEVTELSELVSAGGRPASADITLFKSVGTAISDFAAAELFAAKAD